MSVGAQRPERSERLTARSLPSSLPQVGPKYSEATVRGNIVSTHCFLDVFALAPARYVGLYGVTAPDRRVTTLPKMITNARDRSQNNPLFCLTLPLLSLPKRGAFGKVTCVEKHLLLPQMTASLYLGRDAGLRFFGCVPPFTRPSDTIVSTYR